MLVQKITFTPVDKNKSTINNKINSKNTTPINLSIPQYQNVDYSKIAFGSIYGVKPKKINLDAEKS